MKKILCLALAMIMALSMMSFASAEEPMTITVMLPDFYTDYDFQKDDNPVLKFIEEQTGVKLEITWVANSSYGDLVSTTMADKPENQPMVMVLTGPRDTATLDNARAGAFWDLTDYIPQYENLAAGNQVVYDNISVDGRIYGIYRSRPMARAGVYYRKDIAAAMGIEKTPETIEDLTELAMALAKYSSDTYALNMCKYVAGTIGVITTMMGAPNEWGVDENGNVYPAHQDPHFLEGLNWLRDLYAAGGINPDFMIIESGDWDKQERTEKCFMRFDCMDNGYRMQEWFQNNLPEKVTDENGNFYDIIALVPTLTNAQGEMRMWPQNAGFAGEIVVTKAVKDEETLKKVLSFLDWCCSPLGYNTLNYGLDGVTYWVREDGYRYTKPTDDADVTTQINSIQHSLNQLGMFNSGEDLTVTATTPLRTQYAEINKNYEQYCIGNPCFALESEANNMFGSMLKQTLEDAHVQYIAGKISLEELQAVWQQWLDDGGAMIIEEYNEAYHAAFN